MTVLQIEETPRVATGMEGDPHRSAGRPQRPVVYVARCCAGLVALALAVVTATVQANVPLWDEYAAHVKRAEQISALGPNDFGDRISLQSGALTLQTTEVDIKGNNALPVRISRSFQPRSNSMGRGLPTSWRVSDRAFADWDLDLPHIGGVFSVIAGWPAARCSAGNGVPPYVWLPSSGAGAGPFDYWSGTSLNVPGEGAQLLMPVNTDTPRPTGSDARWVTRDFSAIACLPAIRNGSGEGFIATRPDGTRYWFDWMGAHHEPNLAMTKAHGGPGPTYVLLERRNMRLYATRVEDRFGNWVNYTYHPTQAHERPRLANIQSSDGRSITLDYNGDGFVTRVAAHGRTWTYQYAGTGQQAGLSLVQLPDNTAWRYDLAALRNMPLAYNTGAPGEPYRSCGNPGDPIAAQPTGSVTHPSGATASYVLDIQRFVRAGIDPYGPNCAIGNPSNPNDDSDWVPVAWDAFAVRSKTVQAAGAQTTQWRYQYQAGFSTEVFGPGSYERHTFGNTFGSDEGQLFQVEKGTGPGQILSSQRHTYEPRLSGMPFRSPIGASVMPRGEDFADRHPRPLTGTTTLQDGDSFNARYDQFDWAARPERKQSWSSTGHGRTDITRYYDHPQLWVLGQTQSVTNADTGLVSLEREFSQATALPILEKRFNLPRHSLQYNADGTLASVTDGRGLATRPENWKRGIPQRVVYADGTADSAVVNDSGWITSTTDETGQTTHYGYDAMGHLASVQYPPEGDAGYHPRWINFERLNSDSHGFGAGHWRLTDITGAAVTYRYYDALWRERLSYSFDSQRESSTASAVETRYDEQGRKAFTSYPRRSALDVNSPGTTWQYDALGRVVAQHAASELGTLTTRTDYLPGARKRVTNPRGYAQVHQFQVFDQPSDGAITFITAPEGVTVAIDRDIFGKARSITRTGPGPNGTISSAKRYVYDMHQRLCKTIEPETGATVEQYDAADNLLWRATGLSLTDPGACNPD